MYMIRVKRGVERLLGREREDEVVVKGWCSRATGRISDPPSSPHPESPHRSRVTSCGQKELILLFLCFIRRAPLGRRKPVRLGGGMGPCGMPPRRHFKADSAGPLCSILQKFVILLRCIASAAEYN